MKTDLENNYDHSLHRINVTINTTAIHVYCYDCEKMIHTTWNFRNDKELDIRNTIKDTIIMEGKN